MKENWKMEMKLLLFLCVENPLLVVDKSNKTRMEWSKILFWYTKKSRVTLKSGIKGNL
jgi:hypothetical protein